MRFDTSIRWLCPSCAAAGVVTGWEGTRADRRVESLAEKPMDPSAPPPPLPGSPPPAPPLTVVAITVTKDKYDGDLRELRLMFEEQMQVLQLRNHILQNKIEALEARLEERS